MRTRRAVLAVAGLVASLSCASLAAPDLSDRPNAWRQGLALAVNDGTQAQAAIQAIAAGDRAAFASDVLALIRSKPLADKARFPREFAAAAARLAAGAGEAREAVLSAIATAALVSDAPGGALTRDVVTLVQVTTAQLASGDRAMFTRTILRVLDRRTFAESTTRRISFGAVALAAIAGGGDRKPAVIAELFANTPMSDLGAVSAVLAEAFSQKRNTLANEDYLQLASTVLRAVAERLKGQADEAKRYGYAVAVFLAGAASPATFETALMQRLSSEWPAQGMSKEGVEEASNTAKVDITAQSAVVNGIQQQFGQSPTWGVLILTPGGMLAGEEGPPFVHENRPPGYQNQF